MDDDGDLSNVKEGIIRHEYVAKEALLNLINRKG